MKATELRIGNWVKNTFRKDPYQVYPQFFTQCFFTDKHPYNLEKEISNIDPIPLTEEWLVKFGFEKNYLWKKQLDGKAILAISMVDNSYGLYHSDYSYLTGSSFHMKGQKIKHVHSLQNLYFALTGEELQIKDHD